MIPVETVFAMVNKEHDYAGGWSKGGRKLSLVEGVADIDVHPLAPLAGQPYSLMDFIIFAEKYIAEAKMAYTNFTPDGGAVRIRILKGIGLLIRGLMVHGRASDLERLAGVSSSQFPVLGGGLATFNETSTAEGCLIQSNKTGALRNESPSCDPLKQ